MFPPIIAEESRGDNLAMAVEIPEGDNDYKDVTFWREASHLITTDSLASVD